MVELDEIIRVGPITVAALAQRMTSSDSWHTLWIHGSKRPVAFLIRRDDETVAFDVDGPPIALDDLEQRFPGQLAEFERFAVADTPDA